MEITLKKYDCSANGHIGKIAKDGYELINGDMKPIVYLYGWA